MRTTLRTPPARLNPSRTQLRPAFSASPAPQAARRQGPAPIWLLFLSAFALTNATMPYVLKIANLGYKEALKQDIPLRKGLNLYKGKLTNKAVSEALGMVYTPFEKIDAV